MYRYVPFDDIEKNKWNGTVHYSPNGNTLGYFWYLKSVLKEWGAIIEDDYETVFPIITRPLHQEEYDLIPELGPYSVNYLSPPRVSALFEKAMPHHVGAYYPLNRELADGYLTDYEIEKFNYYQLETINPYQDLASAYADEAKSIIDKEDNDYYKTLSGLKPEDIVAAGKIPNHYQNTLMRIMYNAIHRGIGFSSALKIKKTDAWAAISFFVVSHNKIQEIYQYSTDSHARTILLDLLIRNNGGKPMKIAVQPALDVAASLGFSKMNYRSIQVQKPVFLRLRKSLGIKY